MKSRKLQKFIENFIKEYTGTGASGGNATDGNDITSPRPFPDDTAEILNYTLKNIYGGDGGHYKGEPVTQNPNRVKMAMFEDLKNLIRKELNEQAYGHATLTSQGQYKSRFTKTGRPPGIMENRAQELADSYSVEELNDQLKQLYRDMEQEAEPEGGPIADQYADEIYQYEEAIRIAKGIGGRGKSSQDKSYDEVYLKDKLVGIKDAYEYEVIKGKGRITIYPDLGSLQYKSRSTQEIVFTKDRGEIAFVRAFGYERSYDELKKILPELPEMGDSSFAGFMNVLPNSDIPVDIDTALEMIKAMVRGRDAESKAQSDFYGSRGPTSGTIDEQEDPEQKAYEAGLKRLQKGVIQFQLRYIEKQKSKAMAQAAAAGQQASKGFDDQIEALKDQIKAIDNPPKQDQKEGLYKKYIKLRTYSNLMDYMDAHKRQPLIEGTVKKFFKMFDKGKTNEEVLSYYAKKGIMVPEQFLSKIRKQYENSEKLKLELEFSEQEAKDIVFKPIIPKAQLFTTDDEKKLAKGIYQEKQIKENLLSEKKYKIPVEIVDVLKNQLQMDPLIRFVDKLKAVNTIPPSYRIFLLNGETFDIYYETYSLMVKINEKEYYMADLDERNYAIKHINKLLQEPLVKPETGETGETGGEGETAGGTTPPSPPSPPSPPADEPAEEPEA